MSTPIIDPESDKLSIQFYEWYLERMVGVTLDDPKFDSLMVDTLPLLQQQSQAYHLFYQSFLEGETLGFRVFPDGNALMRIGGVP